MKRIFALTLSLLLLLSLFSGCVSEEKPYVPTGAGLTWDDPNVTEPPTTAPREQELTLTYYPDRGFNPYLCADFTNRALFSLIFQSLFVTNRNYEVEPMLCSTYSVSYDMKTYTVYIHDDVTFSDGTPLTIQDVYASLQTAMASDIYKGRFTRVRKMEISWDGGITFELETAYENFPMLLDVPILKEVQLASENPIGTGPYFFDTVAGGTRLKKRTDWWCEAELPFVASAISLVVAEDEAQIRDEFEFGDLELVCADPGTDKYVDFRCDYELWDCENGIFLYLGVNMDSPVFSNETVRAALTHAIDRERIVEDYYRGFAHPATLCASPLSPYYDSGLAARYEYDGIRFVEALKSTGLSNSEIVLMVNRDDSLRLRVARAIKAMLEDCGLRVTLKALKTNVYLQHLSWEEYDLYLGQTKLSPNMDLTTFFAPGGMMRYGGISDAGIYALCKDALANSGNYYNLHERIAEDGRLVPVLFRSYAVYATRGLLSGLQPARENLFFYSIGQTMEGSLVDESVEPPTEVTDPEE